MTKNKHECKPEELSDDEMEQVQGAGDRTAGMTKTLIGDETGVAKEGSKGFVGDDNGQDQ